MSWTNLLGGLVKPVTDIFVKRQERKAKAQEAEAKITQAKVKGRTSLQMTDAEAEAMKWQAQGDGWKDEVATLVCLSPLIMILAGAVYLSFTGDSRLLDGTTDGITALRALGVDMGFLMEAVVLSAVGLKIWRKI